MMAANSVSSGVSCVPPPCGLSLEGGISGFAITLHALITECDDAFYRRSRCSVAT